MKRIEVLNLPQVFEGLKNAKGLGFAYALMKNKKIIEAEKENLMTSLPVIENYQKFLAEMKALLEDYCIVDQDETVILLDKVVMKEDKSKEEFEIEVNKLYTTYKDAIKERRDNLKEYQNFIKEDTDIEFYKINESNLPDELGLHDLLMLCELIKFEEREVEAIELTIYQILTYVNIFNKMTDVPILSSVNCEARNKCLYNFLSFKNMHKVLYSDGIIKSWSEYEQKRKLLAESHASIDIYGDVLVQHSKNSQDDQFVIGDMSKFNIDLEALNLEYEKELKAFYEFLNQKTSIDICKIKQEELPESTSLEDLQSLEIFIKN